MSVLGGGASDSTGGAGYSGPWRRLPAQREDLDGTYNGLGLMWMLGNATKNSQRARRVIRYACGFQIHTARRHGPGCRVEVPPTEDTSDWDSGTGTRGQAMREFLQSFCLDEVCLAGRWQLKGTKLPFSDVCGCGLPICTPLCFSSSEGLSISRPLLPRIRDTRSLEYAAMQAQFCPPLLGER